jgi:hypothetical protein
MRWKDLAARVLNLPLGAAGLQIVPIWRIQWWTAAENFALWGRRYPCFYHSYNCGWPPYASERCVELALANAWLEEKPSDEAIEIGAVTPYYWPNRVRRVVDPFDPHAGVTDRRSLFDVDLKGQCVLSLSTFEHIGTGDYGSSEPPESATAAFRKVFDEARTFLVTVPTGYNSRVDEFLLKRREIPGDVRMGLVVRDGLASWRQETDPERSRLAYGDLALKKKFPGTSIGEWANAVIVLERGGILFADS